MLGKKTRSFFVLNLLCGYNKIYWNKSVLFPKIPKTQFLRLISFSNKNKVFVPVRSSNLLNLMTTTFWEWNCAVFVKKRKINIWCLSIKKKGYLFLLFFFFRVIRKNMYFSCPPIWQIGGITLPNFYYLYPRHCVCYAIKKNLVTWKTYLLFTILSMHKQTN